MIRLVNVWSSNSADSPPTRGDFVYFIFQHMPLPRVRGFPSPLLCRQLDEHLDSGRKHQKIKLNELQVQCRLWNCVKKEGFCKVNTDQRISKNHILSSFGFVVMSRTSNFSMFLWGTQLVHFAEQGAVQAVFGPPGLLLFGLTKAVPWQPKVPGLWNSMESFIDVKKNHLWKLHVTSSV